LEGGLARCVVVGVAGGSASGKSSVVDAIVQLLEPMRAARLPHDAYYHDLAHLALVDRSTVNVDHPDSLETPLLIRHIGALLRGESIELPGYDYISQTRAVRGTPVPPASVLIVEGLLVLHEPELRALMDLTVFVDAPEEARLARRIARDVRERGRTAQEVVRQHRERVQPMHDRYVAPSQAHADIVIEGGGHNRDAIEVVVRRVQGLVSGW
jgi:uridine kinase